MLEFFQHVFWIGPAVGQAIAALAILRREVLRPLHAFFAYTCWEAVSALSFYVLFLCDPHFIKTKTYFVAFWTKQIISLLLGVRVVQEVFSGLFRPYAALHDLSDTAFRWLLLVFVLLAVIGGVLSPGVDEYRFVAGVYVLERSVRALQVGVVLFLFLFSRAMRLSWRSPVFGIAAGFGLFASARLIAVALRAQMGPSAQLPTTMLTGVGETCAVLIWIVYLLVPEPAPDLKELPAVQLDEWNQALAGLLRR